VPPDIQDGAALGYMNFARSMERGCNLLRQSMKTNKLWPIPAGRFQRTKQFLAMPGRAPISPNIMPKSLHSAMMASMRLSNGLGAVAEPVMDEFGLYKDDPFGRMVTSGQPISRLPPCKRHGIHAMKLTRDQSIDFLVAERARPQPR